MSHTQPNKDALTLEQLVTARNQVLNVMSKKGMSRKKKLLFVVIGALLVVSPVDLMPEVILGPIGLLDDTGYLVAIVSFAISAARQRAVTALAEAGT